MNGGDENRPLQRLVDAGRWDTLYRDIYLQRARQLLQPRLSPQRYQTLRSMRRDLDRLLRQNIAAVEKGDWPRVRELTVEVRSLREAVERSADLVKIGDEVYDPAELAVDPFSPGFTAMGIGAPDVLPRLVAALQGLAEEDPSHAPFYQGRIEHFRHVSPAHAAATPGRRPASPDDLHRQAIKAAQRGDVEALDGLLDLIGTAAPAAAGAGVPLTGGAGPFLASPFPGEAAARGERLGFAAATLEPREDIAVYLHRWAWQPSLPEPRLTQDGHIRIAGIPDDRYPSDTPPQLRDTLDLFLIHPYVNSAGIRYLPLLVEETVLVETFPEERGAGEEGGLLRFLGLPERWRLSRRQIERALLARGPAAVAELFGLDPVVYRLICIPPDLYARLGRRFGWGNQRMWTHFDGYQLLKEGGARALVGGDVRYGGILDLCSISTHDEREEVTVRFAVVRRERMTAS